MLVQNLLYCSKQRPIDLAESQDMRFLLNSTNISLSKLNKRFRCLEEKKQQLLFYNYLSLYWTETRVQQKYAAVSQGDKVISETCKEQVTMINEGNTCNRWLPWLNFQDLVMRQWVYMHKLWMWASSFMWSIEVAQVRRQRYADTMNLLQGVSEGISAYFPMLERNLGR